MRLIKHSSNHRNALAQIFVLREQLSIITNAILLVIFLSFSAETLASKSDEEVLNLDFSDLSAIEVKTASKVDEPILKTIATTYVVTAKDIENSNCRNFTDVLTMLPNVEVTKNSLGKTGLTIRGAFDLSTKNVLFLFNGHVLNMSVDSSGFGFFQDRVPLENIERVEFVKGGGSSLYGANALSAIINVVTYQPNSVKGVTGTLQGEMNDYGLFQRQVGLTASLTDRWYMNFNINEVGDKHLEMSETNTIFEKTGSELANTEEEIYDLQLHYGGEKLTYQARLMQNEAGDYYGFYGRPFDDSEFHSISVMNDLTYRFAQSETSESSVNVYLDYSDIDVQNRLTPDDYVFMGQTAPQGIQLAYGAKTLNGGGKLESNQQLNKNNQLLIGVEFRHESLSDIKSQSTFEFDGNGIQFYPELTDATLFNDKASREIYSGYLQNLWDATSKLRINLGGRYDYYSDFGSTFNPKIGFSYQLAKGLSLKGSTGTAYSAPDFYSLYMNVGSFFKGNEDLKPQTVLSSEFGLDWLTKDVALSTVIFKNDFDEMIAITSDEAFPPEFTYVNQDEASYYGWENSLKWNFGIRQSLTFSYALNKLDTYTTDPGYIPEHSLKTTLFSPLIDKLSGSITFMYRSEMSAPENSVDESIPETTLTDLNFNYQFNRKATLYFSVKNVFDNPQYNLAEGFNVNPLSIRKFKAQDLGRSAFIKFNYDF